MNRFPLVTATLVFALCGIYALELEAGGDAVCTTWGFVPAHPSLHTAISSMFLHDPACWAHLGANLAFLAVFGTVVEGAFGGLVLGILCIAAGLGGEFAHWVLDSSSTTPLVGISGGLFGLLAVAAVVRPRTLGFVVPYVSITVWQMVAGTSGSVSAACHVGGFVVGAIAAATLRAIDNAALEAA